MSLVSNWLESLSEEYKISDLCIRHDSPLSMCKKCSDSCSLNAISFVNGIPEINTDLCKQCGNCIPPCPVQAIEGRSPIRGIAGDRLIIESQPVPTEMELLFFHRKGIRTIVFKDVPATYQSAAVVANQILEGMGLQPFTLLDGETEQENANISRRAFFQKAETETKKWIASSFAPAAWRFNQKQFNAASMFPEKAIYMPVIDSSLCSLCEACFKLCRQKVFTINDGILAVIGAACNGCGLCEDLCFKHAATVDRKGFANAESKMPVYHSVCKECCNPFYHWQESGENICPDCTKRIRRGYLSPYS